MPCDFRKNIVLYSNDRASLISK